MDENSGIGKALFHNGMIGKMIKMAVSQPQANQVPSALGGFIEKSLGRMVRRIEEDRLFGGFVCNEEAVRHRDPAGGSKHCHCAGTAMPISADSLFAACGSTHLTSAVKLSSVGLSGLARNIFLRLLVILL